MALESCPSHPAKMTRFLRCLVLFSSVFAAGSAVMCQPLQAPYFNSLISSRLARCPLIRPTTSMDGKRNSKCSEKISEAFQLRCAFEVFDANFFNDTKVVEAAKDAIEFNIPIFKANRKLVAEENGGLHNPSCLIFKSNWAHENAENASKKFNYPLFTGTKKPKNEEDIAFMSDLSMAFLMD